MAAKVNKTAIVSDKRGHSRGGRGAAKRLARATKPCEKAGGDGPSHFRRLAAEFRAVQLARCGEPRALEELARLTLERRRQLAGYYFKDTALREEAEQQAWFGVLRAVAKYDVSKGIRFSAYVPFHIRDAVGRYRFNVRHPVRLPAHVWEKRRRAGIEAGRDEAMEAMVRGGMRRDVAEMVTRIGTVQIAERIEEDLPAGHCVLHDERTPDSAVAGAEVRGQIEAGILDACTHDEVVAVATRFELDSRHAESRAALTPAERRRHRELVDRALTKLRSRFGVMDLERDGAAQRQTHFGAAEVT